MNIFIVWEVNQLDGLVTTALMSDNSTELRHITNDFERASEDLKQWALANGGNVVLDLKVRGCIAVPPEKAPDFAEVKAKFEAGSTSSLSAGMGTTLGEAQTALRVSKMNGGGQISLYTPQMEQELINQPDESLFGKSLKKDDPEEAASAPAPDSGAEGGGMGSSPSDVQTSTGHAPAGSNVAPGQVQAAPQGSGATNIDEAERQKDAAGGGGGGDPKSMIMSALQEVKAQAGAIEKLKSSAPAAYAAVKDVIQAMIQMAETMAKSDDEDYDTLTKALSPGMTAFNQHLKNRLVTDPPDVDADFNGFGQFFDSQNPVNVNELLQGVPHTAFESRQYPGLRMHVVQGPTGGYVVASKNGVLAGVEPHRVGAEHNAIHPLDTGRVDIKEYADNLHPKMGRTTLILRAMEAHRAKEEAEEAAEAERRRQFLAGPSSSHVERVAQEKAKPGGGVFGLLGEHYVRPQKPVSPTEAKSPLRNPGRNPYSAEFTGPGKQTARPREKKVYTPEQEAKFRQPQWDKDRLDATQRMQDEDAKLKEQGHLKE